MPSATSSAPPQMSETAQQRLRKPLRRGHFREIDAARAQLALLTVADSDGQARLYWLVDLESQRVEDARFLSFGSLASHPCMDAWSELVRERPVAEALDLPLATIEAALRDDPETPAFGDAGTEALAFIAELQDLARAELPQLVVLPKPVEVERYQRKREQDWDEDDRAWLPLSLMQKILKIQQVAEQTLAERLGDGPYAWELEGVNDDFQVRIDFDKGDGTPIAQEERPVVMGFIQEALHLHLHPRITVTEA